MKQFELVIVGGGLTAARAIKSYREAGGGGQVALLAKEAALPYHRPALSKRYLRGETSAAPFVEDEAFYGEHGVELLLGTAAVAVDPARREVTAAAGARYGYRKLLIATGAQPRRLDVPGVELGGVHSLRTLADSEAIRDAAGRAVLDAAPAAEERVRDEDDEVRAAPDDHVVPISSIRRRPPEAVRAIAAHPSTPQPRQAAQRAPGLWL
jgi:NAD(P)H-nitrite reductase large subunit